MKKYDVFRIFAQNIDCEYSLEPPHSNFIIIKVGYKRSTLHSHVSMMPHHISCFSYPAIEIALKHRRTRIKNQFELRYEKTGFLHMRKQRRKSGSR